MPIGRAHILEDKSLHIERVNPQDQGTYICEAENGVGTISASATLTVHCEYCNLLPFSPPLSFSLCVKSRSAVKLITRPVYDYRAGDERRGCCRTEDRRNVAHYRRILAPEYASCRMSTFAPRLDANRIPWLGKYERIVDPLQASEIGARIR